MSEILKDVQSFERDLDAALGGCVTLSYSANQSLGLAANFSEVAASKREAPELASMIDRGMVILAPFLVSGKTGTEPAARALLEDIYFASHYFMLREYLYYSYSVPDAMKWSFTPERIEIRFNDRTIPRQFFTVHNDVLIGSRDLFAGFDAPEKIRELLKGESEGITTPNVEAASELIEQEVTLKLGTYFSLLDPARDIDLGGYTYGQFLLVYRRLMAKCLSDELLNHMNHL